MSEIVMKWTGLFLGCLIAITLAILLSSNSVLAQSEEKTFTAPEFGFSMKYPSDWGYVSNPSQDKNFTTTTPAYYAYLCPSLYLEKEADVPKCSSNSPVQLTLFFYKLKGGTTLKELYDDQISFRESLDKLIGRAKYINTTKLDVSGLTVIQTISTFSSGGSFGKLFQKFGTAETSASKDVNLYMVNGSNGYRIQGHTGDESDFDTYYPTFQKMINSIQIKGAKESPENTAFLPAIKNTPTDDVILLSQKLKKGSGGYNDIIGQVKNIDTTTVDYVKIGLTTYDENGDVIGTDSAYAESTTLKPKQKSTFDIFTPKDSFDGMKNYELSLYWQDILGNDHYVENAQVYKDQK